MARPPMAESMLGAAPSQAPPSATRGPWGSRRLLGAAAIVVVALALFPALAGAAGRSQTARAHHRPKLGAPPRLWAVQVEPGRHGWFDRTLLKRISKDGINALTLRVSALGRRKAGRREFNSVRRFAAAEKLFLVAVLPAGRLHTPAERHAFAACKSHRLSRIRCAVLARTPAAAARRARKHNSVRRLVAVYVKGPHRFSGAARLPRDARRPVLLVAPIYESFDAAAWGNAIGQTAASASVDMGVAPRSRRASSALEQFGAMLASESGAASADTTPPSTPTGLATSSITQTSATLAWDASTDDVGVAGYRLFLNGNEVGTSTATSFSFTGLTCGTSYTLGVAAYDAAGNLSETATTSRSTSACADTQPPTAPTGLAISGIGSASAILTWDAAADNVGVTAYRLFLNGTEVGSSLTTSYLFGGLSCQTGYTLGVEAVDAAGNVSPVASLIAQTASCSDTQPPSTPAGLATSAVGETSLTLSWKASTDNVGVAGYRLFLNGSQFGTSASTSFPFTGLSCGKSYTLGVAAYDAAGNISATASIQKSTSACPDTQPPSTPSGLAASSVTGTSMKLSWKASTDNVGVTGYRLFLNGSQVGSATSTSYSFTGLKCGTSYTLGVAAYDAAGNGSPTATVSQSTSPCADTQPPSTPTGLATSGIGETSVTLSWSASSDNVGVTGYRLFLNGSQVGTSTSTSYSFTGLSCGTSYTLGVAAYDAAGNASSTATVGPSTSACSDTQPPSTPSGLATSSVTQTSAQLSWNASTDNVGVSGYRLFVNGSQVGTSSSTSYSFTGLSCGTSYTLGVAAYDAAGNVSGTATTAATTAGCTSGAGTANIFVSLSGSDASCTRTSSPTDYAHAAGHICATPGKACRLAQSGDVVIVEDGTYSGDFTSCVGHQSYASNVVFEPEPGHECPMTYPTIPAPWSDTSCDVNLNAGGYGDGIDLAGAGGSGGCGVTGNPLPDTLTAAQRSTWINHLTIKGMYIGDFYAICAAYIELDDDAGNHFFIGQGAYHFYIRGGDFGNETDASQPTIGDTTCGCNNWPPAEDVRVEDAVVHDFVTQGSGHGDGFFIAPSYGVQLLGNVLARDDCIPIYVNYLTSYGQGVGVHGLRIIGNVVHTDTIHNGGARCYQAISLGNNDQTDTIVAFNSLEGPIRRSNSSEVNQNIRIVGNVADAINATNSGNSPGCGTGTTASYNVLTGSWVDDCNDSSNALTGSEPFVSADTQPNSPADGSQYFTAPLGDYSIAAGSAGTPAVGRVPASWCNANPGVCPTTDILGNPRPNPAHPSYYDAGAYENR